MTSGNGGRSVELETSAFAFASDLAGEGVDAVLANLQERAGVGSITPAFSYHAARDVFPHNPVAKVQLLDRGEVFFPPDPSLYEGLRISPRVSGLARERDVLAETCRTAAKRGMQVHAWTVFLHADRPGEYSDCVTRNVFGDPYPADLCPAHPDVRAYARALVADVARYEVASITAESLHYQALEHGYHHERYFLELGARARYLLGLCFCDHCLARARRAGVDTTAVTGAVRRELERVFDDRHAAVDGELARADLRDVAGGELEAYLRVRADVVTSLVAEAAEVASAAGRRFVFMDPSGAVKGYATGRPSGGPAAASSWRLGVELESIGPVCDGFSVLAYAAEPVRVRYDLEAYQSAVKDRPLAVCLRPSPPDCEAPENLAAKLAVARELGVASVHFYHYGFVRLEALDWIRTALDQATGGG
ncbi:MAG TPA: hypothetical protein VE984_04540 [Gaiellaceae bacterium]|nr:hypothetical protein [Gaiellaceae bacterium]